MNRKRIVYLMLIFGTLIFINACYYDKAELLYPSNAGATCDTTGVISYSARVAPILRAQCYSCHSATGGSGNINMSNYANDKIIGLNGKLYGSISHASGYIPMPQGGGLMSSCDQAVIKKWITNGCLNN
ncbi:MAG: hypothetical protein NTZ19_11180 [Bacteroidetes bacterium]|nr:hypothetical protein [Bacteroidota bacterium]